MKLFPTFSFRFNPDLTQLIYAIFVLILVPVALAINTIYFLRNVQQDMDFELNNKALLIESIIALHIRDNISEPALLQEKLNEIIQNLPEIKALEVFKAENDKTISFSSTSENTKSVTDSILNQLAWGGNRAFSKQIYALIGSGKPERMWLVAAPLHDTSGEKVGVINLYLSASQIDQISKRTIKDSLLLLVVTMIVILLLLLNHFRFFETSILLIRLRELDKLKDDFISIASHELRTPLTVIKSYAYLLLQNPMVAANKQLHEEAYDISESAKRLGLLVNDILDISRIEQNRMKFTLVPNDLREVITSVIHELSAQAQQNGLQLTYKAVGEPLIVTCDKDKMVQIFINLVGNAVKYTPKGEVTVYHEIKEGKVSTYVKDTGVGISQEGIGKLFQKFSRIYNEETKETTGTGLGLWITKQLTEKMGGKISVESMQHHGTQFIVSFPLTSLAATK